MVQNEERFFRQKAIRAMWNEFMDHYLAGSVSIEEVVIGRYRDYFKNASDTGKISELDKGVDTRDMFFAGLYNDNVDRYGEYVDRFLGPAVVNELMGQGKTEEYILDYVATARERKNMMLEDMEQSHGTIVPKGIRHMVWAHALLDKLKIPMGPVSIKRAYKYADEKPRRKDEEPMAY